MMVMVAQAQPKEDDTKEYSSAFDAVPYPDEDGFGLNGAYALWKYDSLTDKFFMMFSTELEAQ